MEIEYKPEPGERWIPYYLGEKKTFERGKRDMKSYTALVRCPCCGGTHLSELGSTGLSSTGTYHIICNDCNKIVGIMDSWHYNPYGIDDIWTNKELDDYRIYNTIGRLDEIKADFGDPKSDLKSDGIKIRKTKSGKYIVVEGIV